MRSYLFANSQICVVILRKVKAIWKHSMATEKSKSTFPHFATDAIHAGQEPEQWKSMAVVPPISLATTFKQFAPAEHAGFEYSRSGNPTRVCLEKCIAATEGAKHGMCFSSGLATTMTITHLLQLGDHIVSMDDVYGGTNRLFRNTAPKMGLELSFVDCTNLDEVKKAMKPNTKMVWIETPTNPTMKLVDIEAVCKIARAASKDVFIVVDNTFMSSYFQRPLDFGADISMHSLTKYMNGHSDVVMGAAALNRDDLHEKLRFLQNAIGPVPSAFDCYLVNRGLKTLHVRMREHEKNGMAVAKFLESSSRVERVIYPGLPSHPQYELAKRQMKGFSGMVTFLIKGGLEQAKTFLGTVKIFTLAESLGGFESLCEHPGLQTHASVPADQRVVLGISDNLIRLSVGIEDLDDIIEDIDKALKAAIP
ncbi:cystathionine gamma-lyase-like [Gigantopelta aegis]|uniref:cystathionine gamma-lyase-like n=1 Tax=Gigantopelta aegis TaxID=1735272 RepID=UPI001B88B41B|nr:cystathionine gamma-lyase-like [Gigantopelta aegis]